MSRSGNMQMRPMSPVNVMVQLRYVCAARRRGRPAKPCKRQYNKGFKPRAQTRKCTACRFAISRPRSPACRSSPACTSITTRRGRPCTSARRGCCATACAATSARYGMSPRIDALLDEAHRLEVIVTDSVVEALALENNLIKQRSPKYNILLRDDKTYPYLQLTHRRGVPARAGRAPRRARRPLLRRPVHAGVARAQDDVAEPQAVRHPLVQRGDHRRARPPVPRVRHQALPRAVRPRALLARASIASRSSTRSCSSKGRNDELRRRRCASG